MRATTTRFLFSICISSIEICDPLLAIKPGANTTAMFSTVMRVTAEFSGLQRSARNSSLCKKREKQVQAPRALQDRGGILHVKQEHCVHVRQICHEPLQHLQQQHVMRCRKNTRLSCICHLRRLFAGIHRALAVQTRWNDGARQLAKPLLEHLFAHE